MTAIWIHIYQFIQPSPILLGSILCVKWPIKCRVFVQSQDRESMKIKCFCHQMLVWSSDPGKEFQFKGCNSLRSTKQKHYLAKNKPENQKHKRIKVVPKFWYSCKEVDNNTCGEGDKINILRVSPSFFSQETMGSLQCHIFSQSNKDLKSNHKLSYLLISL